MLGGIAAPGSPGLRTLEQLGTVGRDSCQLCDSQNARIRGGKRIRFAQGAEGDILSGPFTDTSDGTEFRNTLFDRSPRQEEAWIGRCRLGQRLHRRPARRGHADGTQVGRSEAVSRGKGASQSCVDGVRDRLSKHSDQLAAEPARRFHCDLLSQHGADGEFKSIPTSRSTQSWPGGDHSSEHRIFGQLSGNGIDVGSDVELMPDAGHNGLKRANRWKLDGGQEAMPVGCLLDRHDALQVPVGDATPIDAIFDDLHVVHGTRPKILQHGLPVIWRSIGNA